MDFLNMLLSMDPKMWAQVGRALSQPIATPQYQAPTPPPPPPAPPAQPPTDGGGGPMNLEQLRQYAAQYPNFVPSAEPPLPGQPLAPPNGYGFAPRQPIGEGRGQPLPYGDRAFGVQGGPGGGLFRR